MIRYLAGICCFLVVASCAGGGIRTVSRFDTVEIDRYSRKSKNLHFSDSTLDRYLGTWKSQYMIIYFDSVVHGVLNKKRRVTADELSGRMVIMNSIENQTYKVRAGSYGAGLLSLSSDEYRLNSDMKIDSVDINIFHWFRAGVLRESFLIQINDSTDINGRKVVESYYELPKQLSLTRFDK